LGADWAAGAVGSWAECAAGRPLRAGEGKRGRAGGRRRAGAPPGEHRLRPRAVLERVGAADVGVVCQGRAGGGVGDRGRDLVADAAARAALTGRARCLGALGVGRARKNRAQGQQRRRGAPPNPGS